MRVLILCSPYNFNVLFIARSQMNTMQRTSETMAKQVFIRRRWNGADTACQTALRSQPKQVANETGKPLILLFSLNQLVFTRILVLPPNYLVEKPALKRRTNGPLQSSLRSTIQRKKRGTRMKERSEKGSLGDGEAEERWEISNAKRHTRCSKSNFVLSNRWQMMMTTTRMVPLVHTSLSLRLCLSFHIRFLLSRCSHKPRYRSLSLPIKVTMTTRTPRLGRDDMRAWKKLRFDRATPRFISILFPASFAATRSTTEENSAIRNQQITRRSPLFTESFLW